MVTIPKQCGARLTQQEATDHHDKGNAVISTHSSEAGRKRRGDGEGNKP
jgi:hypothetical protein